MRTSERKLGPWGKGLDNNPAGQTAKDAVDTSENAVVGRFGDEVYALRVAQESRGDLYQHGVFRVALGGQVYYKGRATGFLTTPPCYADSSDYDAHILSTRDGLFIGHGSTLERAPTSRPYLIPAAPAPASEQSPVRVVVQHPLGGVSESVTVGEPRRVTLSVDGAVYMTRPGGEDFYYVGDFPAGVPVDLPQDPPGALLPSRDLALRPVSIYGVPCTLGSNRAFYAIGAMVFYSEPFRFGLWRANNVIPVGERVVMVAALRDILFVGTATGVFTVTGVGTDSVALRKVASSSVLSYSFCRVPGAAVGQDQDVVAWASDSGVQLGLADGSVATMAADRFSATAPQDGLLTFVDRVFYYIPRG